MLLVGRIHARSRSAGVQSTAAVHCCTAVDVSLRKTNSLHYKVLCLYLYCAFNTKYVKSRVQIRAEKTAAVWLLTSFGPGMIRTFHKRNESSKTSCRTSFAPQLIPPGRGVRAWYIEARNGGGGASDFGQFFLTAVRIIYFEVPTTYTAY